MNLKLVKYQKQAAQTLHDAYNKLEAYEHHKKLIEDYLQSHRIRNHAPKTIQRDKSFLTGWFETHGNCSVNTPFTLL